MLYPGDWQDLLQVEINGQRLPLDTACWFEGEEVIFQYDEDTQVLIRYDANSQFSSRWYARTSPWEDFAEAFSEYLLAPEQLIAAAPEKFQHLELELRRYQNDERIQTLLTRSLENSEFNRKNNKSSKGSSDQLIM